MNKDRLNLRRRQLLIATVVGMIALFGISMGFLPVRRYLRKALNPHHVQGPEDQSPFDRKVLDTIAVFTGALFGRNLSSEDHAELLELLNFAVKTDSAWRQEYSWLARFVDQQARKTGASDLISANPDQREEVVRHVMEPSATSVRSRLFALVANRERERRHMRINTIDHLARLYRFSGVPWRVRGYTRWPGIPGDSSEYIRAGALPQC